MSGGVGSGADVGHRRPYSTDRAAVLVKNIARICPQRAAFPNLLGLQEEYEKNTATYREAETRLAEHRLRVSADVIAARFPRPRTASTARLYRSPRFRWPAGQSGVRAAGPKREAIPRFDGGRGWD